MTWRQTRLVLRGLWELGRYDLLTSTVGFQYLHKRLAVQQASNVPVQEDTEKNVCDAVSLATCFYWRPVACLQRSMVAARLLRKHGVHGRLVIGYRPTPFFSHAWVEVDGRVVNDSAGYKQRLQVLSTV